MNGEGGYKGKTYGLNCASQKSVGVLTPSILRFTDNWAKVRPLGWALVQCGGCPYKKREIWTHRQKQRRQCEETRGADDLYKPRREAWSRSFPTALRRMQFQQHLDF